MDIGRKLKNAREKAALTQEQIAEIIGVSRQTISNWENNRSYPDIVSVLRLSEAYQVSLDVLLKEAEDMKKQEQNQINFLEKYWNAIYSIAVVMFPLARICEYYRQDSLALVLLVLGAALFCLPRLLFHNLFGAGLRNVALGILGWGLAGGSYALRILMGEFTILTWTMAMAGLALVIYVRHKEWSGPAHWIQWAVAAVILIATLIPISSQVFDSGMANPTVPFSRTYRVAEVYYGEEATPIIKLSAYGDVQLINHSRMDSQDLGTLTYQEPQGAQAEQIFGIWNLVPEEDASATYRITVENLTGVIATHWRDDFLQWQYRLEAVDTLQVSGSSRGERCFFTPRWFYEGTFDDYSGSLEYINIYTSGKIGFSWKDDSAQDITLTEVYNHDGQLETREYFLPADQLSLELETRYETGKQEAIYRIPYENGEYVFKVIYQ